MIRRTAGLALAALIAPLVVASAQGAKPAPKKGAAPKTPPAQPVHLVLGSTGVEGRYRIIERLAANTIDNEVIGKTTAITGTVHIDATGKVDTAQSHLVVDLTTLKTDRDRRDGFVQRNTLETAKFPKADVVVTELKGLAWPLPTSGEIAFTLNTITTLHGVTKALAWNVTGTATPAGFTGTAKTQFNFADFEIVQPRVPVVARIDDPIKLELDFTFERQGVAKP